MDIAHIVHINASMIRPVLEYACHVWHTGLPGTLSEKLESVQRGAQRIAVPDSTYPAALQRSGLHDRREELSGRFFQGGHLSPSHKLHHLLPDGRLVCHDLRGSVQRDTNIGKH